MDGGARFGTERYHAAPFGDGPQPERNEAGSMTVLRPMSPPLFWASISGWSLRPIAVDPEVGRLSLAIPTHRLRSGCSGRGARRAREGAAARSRPPSAFHSRSATTGISGNLTWSAYAVGVVGIGRYRPPG